MFNELINLCIVCIENYLLVKILHLYCHLKSKSIYEVLITIVLCIEALYLNRYYMESTIITPLIPIFTLLLYSYFFLENNLYSKIIVIFMLFANLLFINSILIISAEIMDVDLNLAVRNNNLADYVIAFSSKACLFFEYMYLKKYKNNELNITRNAWRIIGAIVIMTMFQFSTVINHFIVHIDKNIVIATIYSLQFYVINLLIYKVCIIITNNNKQILNQQLYIKSMKYENRIVDIIQDTVEKINKWNHDFKNHKRVLEKLIVSDPNKAKSYINTLFDFHTIVYTNNPVINYIINEKQSCCKKLGIDVRCMVIGDISSAFSDVDLNIILSNLLDNAITATKQTSIKYINIILKSDVNKLVINVSNTLNKPMDIKDAKLQTTKKDKDLHGYGIKNIESVCEKYNGYNHYYIEENIFYHICILYNISDNY